MIQDCIVLDADPELFLEKTLDDIYFIDRILRNHFEYLRENNRLIARDELLEQISEADWQFSRIIEEILNNKGNFSVREIPSMREKLINLLNGSRERRKTAESICRISINRVDHPLVSQDEIAELIKAFP